MNVARLNFVLAASFLSGEAAETSGDVTSLAAYNVKADRVEDFGFRVTWHLGNVAGSTHGFVLSVLPNTAAAKAGLRPGDRILKSDGKSAVVTLFSMGKWQKLEAQKWGEVAAGKKNVTWELVVQRPGETETRVVRMTVPTPAPHWGASKWQPPAGRRAAKVTEAGPLAERSRTVLDNGVATMLVWNRAAFMGATPWWLEPDREAAKQLLFGYEWSIRRPEGVRKIFVSQQRGRTEILLELDEKESGTRFYLTSPAGALEKSWWQPLKGKAGEMPPDAARAGFLTEMEFWLEKVGAVSGRWPFEPFPEKIADGSERSAGIVTALAGKQGQGARATDETRATSFLKLPPANEAQRALFAEALGKIGADENCWAYTETSRGLDDKRVTVVRVDPSKPEGERCVLLKVDGKPPTAALRQGWRDEGRDVPAALGVLPPLATLVDITDVRVWSDEAAAFVFELPVRSGNPEFPAEKLQALFRVNKTHRAFEDITMKLREVVRVSGVVRVTEAGLMVRFQMLDPALAPQPVWLKAGGGARVLLVKFTRTFEATRTDFQRVEAHVGETR
jgi:hypothetical protein